MKKKKIETVITIWLVVILVAVCAVSEIVTYFVLTKRSEKHYMTLVRQHVEDISNDIKEITDDELIATAEDLIAHAIPSANPADPEKLLRTLKSFYNNYGVEINVVDKNGIITYSTNSDYVGFDLRSGKQSAAFLVLLDGSTETFVQDLSAISYDNSHLMKYGGKRFSDGSGFLQIGFSEDEYYDSILLQMQTAATNRHIGETGYLLICNQEMSVINSFHNHYTGKNIEDTGIAICDNEDYTYKELQTEVFSVPSFVIVNYMKGFFVIGVLPKSEAAESTNASLLMTLLLDLVMFSILFAALKVLLRKQVVKNLSAVNRSLAAITEGNLNEKVEVRDTLEFSMLSDDINATVDRLKAYIAEAAARIDVELSAAKTIQSSMLPSVFPAFPEHREFELFASMCAVKEVGGDFYDFYLLDESTLGFLIADVSGKSIPGAMFMMTAKTLIKNLAERGLPPDEVLTVANEKLCENNEAEMFVTAWLGYLDFKTGLVRFTNAGHNPPLLVRDGKAEYVKRKPDLMLAVMDSIRFHTHTLQMQKGDALYLYTDGVTEAMDTDGALFGEVRLQKLLSISGENAESNRMNGMAEALCSRVSEAVTAFSADAEQSDDITMLCIRYLGEV